MKGKKSDPEFISNFIKQCVEIGINTPLEIVNNARFQIAAIEEDIKNIEKKKITRSKLLDVVNMFDKTPKTKLEDSKLLSFFKLEYPGICKMICDSVKTKPILVNDEKMDINTKYSIKQLLEYKILSRVGDYIVQGLRFEEYVKFVIREE